MGRKRLEYIDIAKGILIILVVLGHLFPEGYLREWVYGFHVQAFFILSGICVNYSKIYMSDFQKFLRKKLTTIIIPMLLFEFFGGGRTYSKIRISAEGGKHNL